MEKKGERTTGNTNRWNVAIFCRKTARLTGQNDPQSQKPRIRGKWAPEFLIFHFTCQEPKSHKKATSFKSEYSLGAHRQPWDRQTNQMLLWMHLFLLNHYKKMNGICKELGQPSKILATPWHLLHNSQSWSSSCCLLQFFLFNLYFPLFSMLGNTICKSLIMEVECLHKVLEPQWTWCLHGLRLVTEWKQSISKGHVRKKNN